MNEPTLHDAPLAFITGASSGIGQALAARFARAGYRLALVARRSEELQAWARAQGFDETRCRVYRADADCRVRVDVSRLSSKSWGLFGGHAGGHGAVECGPGVVFDKDNAVLKAGQWFAVVSPGAGGYGAPEKRDRPAVARDLAEGVISPATAQEVYGYTG